MAATLTENCERVNSKIQLGRAALKIFIELLKERRFCPRSDQLAPSSQYPVSQHFVPIEQANSAQSWRLRCGRMREQRRRDRRRLRRGASGRQSVDQISAAPEVLNSTPVVTPLMPPFAG